MVNIKSNADQTANKLIFSNGVRGYYLSVCERYSNGYVQTFITDFQILITKLAIVITKISSPKKNISYCSQAITYLTKSVLNRPDLEQSFSRIGVNDKGNDGKHDITTNDINMDLAVSIYNEMVRCISSTYRLPSLNNMIITKDYTSSSKRPSQPKPSNHNNTPVVPQPKPADKQPKKPKQKPIQSRNVTIDEKMNLDVRLIKGDGRYTKGLFKKTSMVNFKIDVEIANPNNLKIVSVRVKFKCKSNVVEMKLPASNRSTTEVNLKTELFSGVITATVVAIYKIGLFKTKKITASVNRDF